ncbi:hypothetical protein SAMN05720354_1017 [Nitrosospira sp. Nsp1]|nr:hypothetical protein SAMN05720354_1017 [Nitrosospira sp. Nsp1]
MEWPLLYAFLYTCRAVRGRPPHFYAAEKANVAGLIFCWQPDILPVIAANFHIELLERYLRSGSGTRIHTCLKIQSPMSARPFNLNPVVDGVKCTVFEVQGKAQRRGMVIPFQGVATQPCATKIVQFTP